VISANKNKLRRRHFGVVFHKFPHKAKSQAEQRLSLCLAQFAVSTKAIKASNSRDSSYVSLSNKFLNQLLLNPFF
jgi:hypothetical protein